MFPSAAPGLSSPPLVVVTPLVLSDRLITLAEQADRAGMRGAAERILRLACRVLNEPPAAAQ